MELPRLYTPDLSHSLKRFVSFSQTGANGSSDSTSGKGDKSDQSQHTANQGKPVRGGKKMQGLKLYKYSSLLVQKETLLSKFMNMLKVHLKLNVPEFHPNLIGLTGNPDEIKKAARAFWVYYMKTAEEGSDYLVDHSIIMYLMDSNMEFVKFFGKNNDVHALADGIIQEIKRYKKVTA